MKPKTKLQTEVLRCSRSLNVIDAKIQSFAKDSCIENKGFATKNRVICLCCGNRFSTELVSRNRANCPHCGKRLSITKSACRKYSQHIFIGYAQIYGDFQVVRYFEVYSHHSEGSMQRVWCHEVLQQWFDENNKLTIVAKQHNFNAYVDSWGGDLEIRVERYGYYSYQGTKYDCVPDFWHPSSSFMKKYSIYGINDKLKHLSFKQAISYIPDNAFAETLLKCKRYDLLSYLHSHGRPGEKLWTAIKICIRNNYKIKDVSIWVDYVNLLIHFDKDIHNAFYVCPKNLNQEHDRLVKKKRELDRRQAEERKRNKIAEYEKQFLKLKAHLLGIIFIEDEITIKTLDSVQEYMEEGDVLHHCIYESEYFSKPNSLCLSARVNGQPVETIEIDLKKKKVVQCRGKFNSPSQYHDRVLRAVERVVPLICQRLNKSRNRQLKTA